MLLFNQSFINKIKYYSKKLLILDMSIELLANILYSSKLILFLFSKIEHISILCLTNHL